MLKFLRRTLPMPIKDLIRSLLSGFLKIIKGIIRLSFKSLELMLGKRLFLRMSQFVGNEIDRTLEVAGIKFDATNLIPYLRAVTILTKEPDTIAWIDDHVHRDDVLYDIGANIGVFTLYAGLKVGARVFAFEPFAENYAILNRNIFLNGLAGRASALNIAIHNKTMFSHLNVSELWPGKAGHSFNAPIGSHGDHFKPKFLQGVIGISVDQFVELFQMPFPNHVKIDVDGNEHLIVEGMRQTLNDPRLKSIAIEINNDLPNHVSALEKIRESGFEALSNEKYVNHEYLSHSSTQNYFLIRRQNV